MRSFKKSPRINSFIFHRAPTSPAAVSSFRHLTSSSHILSPIPYEQCSLYFIYNCHLKLSSPYLAKIGHYDTAEQVVYGELHRKTCWLDRRSCRDGDIRRVSQKASWLCQKNWSIRLKSRISMDKADSSYFIRTGWRLNKTKQQKPTIPLVVHLIQQSEGEQLLLTLSAADKAARLEHHSSYKVLLLAP